MNKEMFLLLFILIQNRMEGIYDANDTFKFEKLVLTKPTIISGGNYFIKLLVNDNPLYIQPPKCKLKQGISKAGKRMFADLMFTNENDQFIRWMENLENHCQKNIFNNREQWFDGELEMADIENYFTPPLKVYKSGKFYIIRTNITTMLGKSVFKIYDENEKEVDMDNINENMNIMTILEIQGIKCSARSFQIEIELKQMLVMNPINIFDKCLLRTKHQDIQQVLKQDNTNEANQEFEPIMIDNANDEFQKQEPDETEEIEVNTTTDHTETLCDTPIDNNTDTIYDTITPTYNLETKREGEFETQYQPENKEPRIEIPENDLEKNENDQKLNMNTLEITNNRKINYSNGLEEVEFQLEELPETEIIQIKKRNEVYYEMYREARRKAKIARNLALSSYLEAKRIKNTYMLEDIKDSDDSDLDMDLDNEDNNENER